MVYPTHFVNTTKNARCSIIEHMSEFADFHIGKEIGQGAYGIVYECHFDGLACVMKTQASFVESFNDVKKFIEFNSKEIGIMMHLQDIDLSPIVYHYCFLYNQEKRTIVCSIIMERLSMSDTLIESNESLACELTVQALDASNRLVQAGISHRDYKWANIGYRMDYSSGNIILIPLDFGLAKYTDEYTMSSKCANILSMIDRACLASDTCGLDVKGETKTRIINILNLTNIGFKQDTNKTGFFFVQKRIESLYTKLYKSTL